jgi:hypothetical protein
MAEMERVKRDQKMYKAFTSLEGSTKKTLETSYMSICAIEKGSSDVLKN